MGEPEAAGGAGPGAVVAVTRSVDDNRSLTERLIDRGHDVVAVPLVEVLAPADDGRALTEALTDLDRYRWVVLTSVNGVRAVAARVPGRGWPDGPAVAVVGPTTEKAARRAGMPVALVPAEATAAALVEAFPAAVAGDPNRVLAPLAELASDAVEHGLEAKGWSVTRVEAYRTAAPPPSVAVAEDRVVDAVTLFSPSAADRWVERFGPRPPLAVCIGPATAARARDRGFAQVVTADPHTEDGVVAAIDRVLG